MEGKKITKQLAELLKKTDGHGPSVLGWSLLHFQVASFLRVMAANLSFTQFVT